jgi:hypothetical protein
MRRDTDVAISLDGRRTCHITCQYFQALRATIHGVDTTPSDNIQYGAKPVFCQARRPALPTVVRERLVGLGHAVGVFTLAYGGTTILGGLQ